MSFKKTSVQPFKAIINIGLQWNYTDKLISKSEVIKALSSYQKSKMKDNDITLSVSVKETLIVLADQLEPHLELSIINYPRFPLDIAELKSETQLLVEFLMEKFNQNRVVIEYLDEIVMLEKSSQIDPRVQKYNPDS